MGILNKENTDVQYDIAVASLFVLYIPTQVPLNMVSQDIVRARKILTFVPNYPGSQSNFQVRRNYHSSPERAMMYNIGRHCILECALLLGVYYAHQLA